MKLTLVFSPERETKNTWLFKEQPKDGLDEVIGSLYVKKALLQAAGVAVPGPIEVSVNLTPEAEQ
jgi:hypothetical protein